MMSGQLAELQIESLLLSLQELLLYAMKTFTALKLQETETSTLQYVNLVLSVSVFSVIFE